jgi:hypothetical protein
LKSIDGGANWWNVFPGNVYTPETPVGCRTTLRTPFSTSQRPISCRSAVKQRQVNEKVDGIGAIHPRSVQMPISFRFSSASDC